MPLIIRGFADCRKTYITFKNGCLALLALLVLHRAKLLASNQSILALGRSPKRGEGGSPTFSPFPGERGQGDRDNKSEVNFKKDFFTI